MQSPDSSSTPPGPHISSELPGVSVVEHRRELHVYRVTDEELSSLASVGDSKTMDIGLLTFFGGLFLALLGVLLSSPPTDRVALDIYILVCIGSAIGACVFFFRVRSAFRREADMVARIKGK